MFKKGFKKLTKLPLLKLKKFKKVTKLKLPLISAKKILKKPAKKAFVKKFPPAALAGATGFGAGSLLAGGLPSIALPSLALPLLAVPCPLP